MLATLTDEKSVHHKANKNSKVGQCTREIKGFGGKGDKGVSFQSLR